MSKKIKSFLFCTILAILLSFPMAADERSENIDIYIILDKSLSMEEEISAVVEYVNTSILDQLLIPGDFLVIIGFFGDTERIVSQDIKSKDDIEQIKKRINTLKANGRFTDIGNALDILKKTLEDHKDRGRKEYLLLITDGIQEAPKTSKYYSPDGTFNHAFLENAKTIQKEGWKIQILGIGTASAAKEIAATLAGEYTEVPENITAEELSEKTKDILGTIQLKEAPKLLSIGRSGVSEMTFKLASYGYVERKNVYVDRVEFET
ncbi:MAG: VWA domain-containing protein, partial [Spirochaetales bacterium]